jgi:hypothetical protein
VEGVLPLYRREILRAMVLNDPPHIIDTVAAVDMALGDQDAARVWQQAAVDAVRRGDQTLYRTHLQLYQRGEALPRTGGAVQRTDFSTGHADERDGQWHGQTTFERDGWKLHGWMVEGAAAGPWSFAQDEITRASGHFQDGRMIGPWRFMDAEGALLAEGLILQHQANPTPQRVGWWRIHDPDTGRYAIGPYGGSRPVGEWRGGDPADQEAATAWRSWNAFASDPANREWLPRIMVDLPDLPAIQIPAKPTTTPSPEDGRTPAPATEGDQAGAVIEF